MASADITGIGWVTAAGLGCGREHESFAMPGGQLPEINPADIFNTPYPNFRRMDEYTRLGLAAIAFALQDAGLAQWTRERNIGIIVSTVYGCLGTDVDYYNTVIPNNGCSASPALFSYTSPNSFLGEAGIRFGLTGTGFAITVQFRSGLAGLQAALDHLAWGESQKILGGVCDLGCPPLFGEPGKVPPGAVFFMLDKSPGREISSYGKLCLDPKGRVIYHGSEIKDLTTLVQKCLLGRNRQIC